MWNTSQAAPLTSLKTERAELKHILLCYPQPLTSVRWLWDTQVTLALLGPANDLISCFILYRWSAFRTTAGGKDKDATSCVCVWADTVLVSS